MFHNNNRLQETVLRRTAEIIAALEDEITASKRAGANHLEKEKLLACFLSLKHKDLSRFRLSEWLLSPSSANGCHTRLPRLAAPRPGHGCCVEVPCGRPAIVTSSDLASMLEKQLEGDKRILIVAVTRKALDEHIAVLDDYLKRCESRIQMAACHPPSNRLLERLALQQTCDELLAILTARSALTEDIAQLNRIHKRLNELSTLQFALRVHLKESERAGLPAQMADARERLAVCDSDIEQLGLEVVSRQAFITETTRLLLQKLHKHAPSFAAAVDLLRSNKRLIAQIDSQQGNACTQARILLCTLEDTFSATLIGLRFDAVLVLNAEHLSLSAAYWLGGLAKSAFIMFAGSHPLALSTAAKAPRVLTWLSEALVGRFIAPPAAWSSGSTASLTLPSNTGLTP